MIDRWQPVLPDSFPPHGLKLTHFSRLGPLDTLRKPSTDNWMMALEETGTVIIRQGGKAGAQISLGEFSSLLEKVVGETQNGVNLWIDMMVVVGRKQ